MRLEIIEGGAIDALRKSVITATKQATAAGRIKDALKVGELMKLALEATPGIIGMAVEPLIGLRSPCLPAERFSPDSIPCSITSTDIVLIIEE